VSGRNWIQKKSVEKACPGKREDNSRAVREGEADVTQVLERGEGEVRITFGTWNTLRGGTGRLALGKMRIVTTIQPKKVGAPMPHFRGT